MINILTLGDDVKFAVMDLLRDIGMGLVNMIFSAIDTLYDIANNINCLNLIQMLQDIENSPFTKIFNAFFILAFIVLFLFAIWKITFRIIDADVDEQPLFELVKEIIKCGVLIFSVVLIFNTTIDIGSKLSSAIYNNFTTADSSLGDKMQSAYMTVNEKCYKQKDGENTDKNNVDSLKDYLNTYTDLSSIKTMKDFESQIRSNHITTSNIIDSGAFNSRCEIFKTNKGKDGEDYNFNYNFLFGIVIGTVFLISIGFAVLMLGKRQIELAFLMVISPLVFATSIGRKEQRSALYQQLTSLVLQAGAIMLLIGITSILFNTIQNNSEINSLDYFPKIVMQSVLYLACAMMLMAGSTTLNRFIGENVSANSGREMLSALGGIHSFVGGVASKAIGGIALSGRATQGAYGLGKMGLNFIGHRNNQKSLSNSSKLGDKMKAKAGSGINNMMKGSQLKESSNPFARAYGGLVSGYGQHQYNSASKKWDILKDDINDDYKSKLEGQNEKFVKGKENIKKGFGNIGKQMYYRSRRYR